MLFNIVAIFIIGLAALVAALKVYRAIERRMAHARSERHKRSIDLLAAAKSMSTSLAEQHRSRLPLDDIIDKVAPEDRERLMQMRGRDEEAIRQADVVLRDIFAQSDATPRPTRRQILWLQRRCGEAAALYEMARSSVSLTNSVIQGHAEELRQTEIGISEAKSELNLLEEMKQKLQAKGLHIDASIQHAFVGASKQLQAAQVLLDREAIGEAARPLDEARLYCRNARAKLIGLERLYDLAMRGVANTEHAITVCMAHVMEARGWLNELACEYDQPCYKDLWGLDPEEEITNARSELESARQAINADRPALEFATGRVTAADRHLKNARSFYDLVMLRRVELSELKKEAPRLLRRLEARHSALEPKITADWWQQVGGQLRQLQAVLDRAQPDYLLFRQLAEAVQRDLHSIESTTASQPKKGLRRNSDASGVSVVDITAATDASGSDTIC